MEMINISESAERGKIFVWGDYGQVLKNIDSVRIHAIAQANPNKYLAFKSNEEIIDIIKEIKKSGEISDKLQNKIETSIKNDTLFKEISKLMRYESDMLSIGSFLTGEKQKNKAFMKMFSENADGD